MRTSPCPATHPLPDGGFFVPARGSIAGAAAAEVTRVTLARATLAAPQRIRYP